MTTIETAAPVDARTGTNTTGSQGVAGAVSQFESERIMLTLTEKDIADAESQLAAMKLKREAAQKAMAATTECMAHTKLQSAVWRFEEWVKALKARLADQGATEI